MSRILSSGLYSNNSDHWETPQYIYDLFVDFNFIDPCPLHSSVDNLDTDYINDFLFINPPYSDIKSWVNSIANWYNKGCFIALLIPSRTDIKYFHFLLDHVKLDLYFFKGRLHFNNSVKCAPFPSMLVFIHKDASFRIIDDYVKYIKGYFYYFT